MHDLATGGAVDILSQGALPYAEADSTELSGALPFVSNKLSTTVDGAAAEKVRASFAEKVKRAVLQSDCTGTRGTSTRTALTNCRSLALAASSAASSGSSSKFSEYFKTTSSSTRSAVAATFSKVASECGSTTSGASDYYCTDVYGYCESNVLAYTIPSQSIIVNCPLYYSALPALTSSCHDQDQATTTLHEATHLTEIAGTDDLGYGYSAATSLSTSQALNNADSYALYANGMSDSPPFVLCSMLTDSQSHLRQLLNASLGGTWAATKHDKELMSVSWQTRERHYFLPLMGMYRLFVYCLVDFGMIYILTGHFLPCAVMCDTQIIFRHGMRWRHSCCCRLPSCKDALR